MTTRERVLDFMARKRLTFVGVSRNEKSYSRGMLRAFRERGYDVAAINPQAEELDGLRCFHSLREIESTPDGVVLLTKKLSAEALARECAALGVKRLWIPLGMGRSDPSVTDFCQQNGIEFIYGFCPYMFLQDAGFVHRIHGLFAKLGRRWRS